MAGAVVPTSSAGARMAAAIGSHGAARFGGATVPRPSAVILLYTGHSENYLHAADLIQPCGRTLYKRAPGAPA